MKSNLQIQSLHLILAVGILTSGCANDQMAVMAKSNSQASSQSIDSGNNAAGTSSPVTVAPPVTMTPPVTMAPTGTVCETRPRSDDDDRDHHDREDSDDRRDNDKSLSKKASRGIASVDSDDKRKSDDDDDQHRDSDGDHKHDVKVCKDQDHSDDKDDADFESLCKRAEKDGVLMSINSIIEKFKIVLLATQQVRVLSLPDHRLVISGGQQRLSSQKVVNNSQQTVLFCEADVDHVEASSGKVVVANFY